MANEAAFGCLIHRASGVSLLRSTSGGIGMSLGLGFLDFFGSASGFVFLLHLEILAQIDFATLGVSSTTSSGASNAARHYAFWVCLRSTRVHGPVLHYTFEGVKGSTRMSLLHRQRHHSFLQSMELPSC